MLSFISEENYRMHLDYLNTLKLKASVIARAMTPESRGRRHRRADFDLVDRLRCEVALHGVYFNSFSEREYVRSDAVSKCFGSDKELLNELLKRGMECRVGFVGVKGCSGGAFEIFANEDYRIDPKSIALAIDVSEHAYFYDYGFDKKKYLGRALSHLSLDKLDEFS